MARLPRPALPGQLQHVIQRSGGGQPAFQDAADYRRMLELLGELCSHHKIALHGYVLLPTEIHLLLTSPTDRALALLMQSLGRRYVQSFNRRHQRSGGLWGGRYRASVVQAEPYLFTVQAYLDVTPVRAGLVARAADYAWSSHRHYAGLQADSRVTPHALHWQLGNTPFAREARYAELIASGLSAADLALINASVLKGWALGEPKFVAALQAQSGTRLSRVKAGRPSSSSKSISTADKLM